MKKFNIFFTLLFVFASSMAQIDQFIDFEGAIDLIQIDTIDESNVWEIGIVSEKSFFDTAYSDDKALVTNLSGTYPNNNLSSFFVKIPTYSGLNLIHAFHIDFFHMFQTDSLSDGGFVEVSYDGGNTWINAVHDTLLSSNDDTEFQGYYAFEGYSKTDTLNNGIAAFTGTSKGWQRCGYLREFMNSSLFESDTIVLKVTFYSDSKIEGVSKDGWIIDDFSIFAAYGLVDVENQTLKEEIDIYCGSDYCHITLHNSNSELTVFELFSLNGKKIKSFRLPDTSSFSIDINGLKPGVYIYLLSGVNSAISGKIIL
ncbi:MAG: T9SS type A sorting domain-containing protein [Cyclobacteriaceae bacterium]